MRAEVPAQRAQADAVFAMRFAPPGPVAAAFGASTAPNPVIIGPVGSGKTTQCTVKGLDLANRVPLLAPTVDSRGMSVKRCRVGIVARTYRVMWKNFLPSYFKVYDKTWGKWAGGEGEPWVHRFQLRVPNQQLIIDMQFDGLAVGDASLDDLTRGLELTGAYIYEWDTLPKPNETVSKFFSRCGRYPNMPTGELQDEVPRQVWCDGNAFDPDHECYDTSFGDAKPPGREVFLQPGGRSADAENIHNVGRRYYEQQLTTLKPWEVARLVDNRFVPDRPGFVVHSDWNPLQHAAGDEIKAEPTLPLLIGIDQGSHAAAVITQRLRPKVWRALDELTVPRDEGWTAKKFAERLTDHLGQNYPRHAVLAIIDPAAKARTGVGGDEENLTWLLEFMRAFPYPVQVALSNRVKGKSGTLSAVRDVLCHMDGGEPALRVSSRCKVLRKGFNGAYRFKSRPNEPGVASTEIDKNFEANIQNAFEYVVHTIDHGPDAMHAAAGREHRNTGAPDAPAGCEVLF